MGRNVESYTYKIRSYLPFNISEIRSIAITILFLTFIVAFNDGNGEFQMSQWLANFLLWFIIITISVIVKQIGHRLVGLLYGFRVEYKIWWYGLMFGVLIAFVTRGHVWVLVPGGIMIHIMKFHRLGWFRYGTNYRAFSIIALFGPLANIFFATFVKTLQIWFHLFPAESAIVDKLFLFNLAFAAYNLLPIPPLDGSRVMYDSRLIYVFVFVAIATYAILAYFEIYSYILALIAAVIGWFLFYHYFEK